MHSYQCLARRGKKNMNAVVCRVGLSFGAFGEIYDSNNFVYFGMVFLSYSLDLGFNG